MQQLITNITNIIKISAISRVQQQLPQLTMPVTRLVTKPLTTLHHTVQNLLLQRLITTNNGSITNHIMLTNTTMPIQHIHMLAIINKVFKDLIKRYLHHLLHRLSIRDCIIHLSMFIHTICHQPRQRHLCPVHPS